MANDSSKRRAEPLVLLVCEVAARLKITEQHVLDLIEAGELGAIDVGGSSRHFYRIPVPEFERFMSRRNSLNNP